MKKVEKIASFQELDIRRGGSVSSVAKSGLHGQGIHHRRLRGRCRLHRPGIRRPGGCRGDDPVMKIRHGHRCRADQRVQRQSRYAAVEGADAQSVPRPHRPGHALSARMASGLASSGLVLRVGSPASGTFGCCPLARNRGSRMNAHQCMQRRFDLSICTLWQTFMGE